MQELAILLSSIAGAASAVAVNKFPKGSARLQSIGASAHVKGRIGSLKIEKDILNKTIARLYEEDSGLSRIQKDRLLLRYQHQLGIILAKLERLEAAGRHPDLGPVGDGLITLMDQKLSQLDSRLYELSSKIAASGPQAREEGADAGGPEKPGPAKGMRDAFKHDEGQRAQKTESVEIPKARKRPMEITTLTSIPKSVPKYPFEEKPRPAPRPERPPEPQETGQIPRPNATREEEILRAGAGMAGPDLGLPDPESRLPKPAAPKALPRPEEAPKTAGGEEDGDDDDLEKIKGEILKTLSKLEQAEVE